jgi:tetratricopeptide (TPR) repeat protein
VTWRRSRTSDGPPGSGGLFFVPRNRGVRALGRRRSRRPLRAAQAATGLLTFGWLSLALFACAPRPKLEPVPEVQPPATVGAELAGELAALRKEVGRASEEAELTAAERAAAFGEAGRHYHALELLLPAAACYRNAHRLAPEEADWPYYLGHVALSSEDAAEAARWFATAAELEPGNALDHLMLGRALSLQGEAAEALVEMRRALELDPELALAEAWSGDIALSQRRFAPAVTHFEAALRLQPSAGSLYVPLAQALRAQGRSDETAAALARRNGQVVRLADPRLQGLREVAATASGSLQRGSRAFEQGDYAAAATAFSAAASADPTSAEAQLNLGAALTRLNAAAGAEAALRRAVELAPANARARLNLGSLLCAMGRMDDGLPMLDEALRLEPGYEVARARRAEAYLTSGSYVEAAQDYLRLTRDEPAEVAYWQRAAVALALAGEAAEAERTVTEGLAAHPNAPSLVMALARLVASNAPDRQAGESAVELLEPLLRSNSSLALIESLAMAYAAAGRFEEATTWQRRALEAVRSAGRDDLVPTFEGNLERYGRRQRAAAPWTSATWAL